MLVSHSHRFIFVHIQKTAGQSMKRVLEPYCARPPRIGIRRLLSHLPIPEDPHKVAFRPHSTAAWARMKLTPPLFDRYCRFTVVRNPFDRAVSNYHFVRQNPEHHTHKHASALTFDEYLDFLKRRRWRRDPTQIARLVDGKGALLCDPILRFESLDADFKVLCRQLGLEASTLPRRNASLHEPFRNYYGRRATRDKAIDLFAKDFDAFGYDTTL